MTRFVYDFATEVTYESRKENIAKVVPTKLNLTRTPVSDTDIWLFLSLIVRTREDQLHHKLPRKYHETEAAYHKMTTCTKTL